MIFRLSGEVLTRTANHDLPHADVRVLRAAQVRERGLAGIRCASERGEQLEQSALDGTAFVRLDWLRLASQRINRPSWVESPCGR
jgi:hypothetical protein